MSFPIIDIGDLGHDLQIMLIAQGGNGPFFDCGLDGATGFIEMQTVWKTASGRDDKKLSEIVRDIHGFQMVEGQHLDAWGINDKSSLIQGEHLSEGGRMLSFA